MYDSEPMMMPMMVARSQSVAEKSDDRQVNAPSDDVSLPSISVRDYFPESWLWDLVDTKYVLSILMLLLFE